jgi:hypothetical protein
MTAWWYYALCLLALVVFACIYRLAVLDGRRRAAQDAYRLRVATRDQPVPDEAMLEALRVAMVITCRAYSARLETLVSERVAAEVPLDRFVRDADRAHDLLEAAMAPGLRVVT